MFIESNLESEIKKSIIEGLDKLEGEKSIEKFIQNIQPIINSDQLSLDSYIYCKQKGFKRLNQYVAYNINGENIEIHLGAYDFRPLLRTYIKEYGKNAKEMFIKTYEDAIKDALEKCKYILECNPNLNGVMGVSFQVSKYKELFLKNGMTVTNIPEKLAKELFPGQNPEIIMKAYIGREELLNKTSGLSI